jgi:hypothetical protein
MDDSWKNNLTLPKGWEWNRTEPIEGPGDIVYLFQEVFEGPPEFLNEAVQILNELCTNNSQRFPGFTIGW